MIRMKNMGACNADKVDVYKKLSLKEMEGLVKEIQIKQRGIVQNLNIKGVLHKRKKIFYFPGNKCLKCHIFILFGKFSKILQLVGPFLQDTIEF